MSYRIARITRLYSEYILQYQTTFAPIIISGTFQEQYDHLVNDSFDTASSISRHFRKIGVDATDIFANADWLQDQWKKENASQHTGKELVFEQIRKLQPEVVWIDDPQFFDADWISHLRQNVRSIKIVTGLVCAPYSSTDLKNLRAFDLLTTCTPCLRQEFEESGLKSFLVYHAFDEDILGKIDHQNTYPEVDLLFTGSMYAGGGYHFSRIDYLESFLKANIPVKIYGKADSTSKILAKMGAFYAINFLKKIGVEKLIPQIPVLKNYESFGDTPIRFYSRKLKVSLSNPIYGLDQFKLLSKARICFNIHGEIAKQCAGNLRLFEATGVGACLVTDWKKNLDDLFESDKEIVTYKSKAECIDKIKWLLNNPAEADKIRKAGQARVLKDHTIAKRTEMVNEILKRNL